tara:strand:- start:395 stop:808 length:414 start_codon:yes stop_codon:yes gene_type:complete
MKNIWDWLKQINSTKADPNSFSDKDWELWNSYMVHRFLSMNPDFLDIVNFVQIINPQNKKEIYSVYREYIPKNNKWSKYIKSKVKQSNKDLVEHLSSYWECSSKETKEYLEFLDTDEIGRILMSIGLNNKEIKTITK